MDNQTTFTYYTNLNGTGSAAVEAAMTFNGGNSVSDHLTVLDAFGRTSLSQTLDPGQVIGTP